MRRHPDNQLALVKQVECILGRAIRSTGVEQEVWSASDTLHLTVVWRATATPVYIKVGVNTNQLYWCQPTALAEPSAAPLQ